MKPFYEPINTIDTNEFQAYVNTKFEGIISNGELGISNFESFMIFNNISSAELTAIYITFAEFEKLSISTKPVHNFPEIIECIRKFIFADQSLDLRPRFITQDTISSKNIMERSAIFTDMNNTLENKKENFFNLYTNNVEKDCSIAFDSYLQPIEDLKEGQRLLNTTNPVILPVGTYVKVLITSDDVIHS
jgi:heme/copper-type cytochrome/quinol oxidase subunit 2